MCDLDHQADVVFDEAVVAALERADVDDHVHFPRPVKDRAARFICFDVRERGAEREADDGANGNTAAGEITRSDAHPCRIHADGSKAISRGFVTEFLDVFVSRFGLQQGVIYQTRPLARGCGLAEHETDASGAGIYDAMHPLGAAMT